MKVYIFNNIEQLTNNYHSEGGLVVIAEDMQSVERFIDYANNYSEYDDTRLCEADINLTIEDWKNVITYETGDHVAPAIFIYPDAGCC